MRNTENPLCDTQALLFYELMMKLSLQNEATRSMGDIIGQIKELNAHQKEANENWDTMAAKEGLHAAFQGCLGSGLPPTRPTS